MRWKCLAPLLLLLAGCTQDGPVEGHLEAVWGRIGLSDGRFNRPRAMAIDAQDRLYVVDITARIQVFSAAGEHQRTWTTPIHTNGRPTGMSIAPNGDLLVADTHYYRVLVYSPEGELKEKIGGTFGHGPGEFGFVTDAVRDQEGNLYVSEYGEYDRIQKFSPSGEFILQWGGHGSEPGQFIRPQCLVFDAEENLWVADACNHRIQVFSRDGKLLKLWGVEGQAPGELSYPYGICLDGQGHLYACEYGNHRIQKFTLDGKSLGCWGKGGRKDGELFNPWALVRDSKGKIHVLDSNNHRLQRIVM